MYPKVLEFMALKIQNKYLDEAGSLTRRPLHSVSLKATGFLVFRIKSFTVIVDCTKNYYLNFFCAFTLGSNWELLSVRASVKIRIDI